MKSNGKITKIYNLRGKLNFPIPEDGIDTSDATAVVEDIKQGKTVYARGQKLTGTMPNRGSVTISPNTVSQEHDSGYYDSIKVNAVTNEIDTNIKSENIKKDISILGITGILEEGVDTSDADAAAANIEINKTAYVDGEKITGNLPLNNTTLVVDNVTVSLDDRNNKLEMNSTNLTKQIIDNNVNMKFNANYSDVATTIGLTPDKIKRGETILNVAGNVQEGIDTSNANALASDLAEGKTAYVNGLQITGTLHEDNGALTQQAEEVTINEGDILQFKQIPVEDDFIARAGYSKTLWARPENVTPIIGLTADKLVSGNTVLGVEGTHVCPPGLDTSDANAIETDILSGKTAYVNGNKIIGTITLKEAQTYIPSSSEQVINAGQYLSGAQTISPVPTEEKTITPSASAQEIMPTESKFLSKVTVSGDANLIAENVKSGVTIFGIEGSYTSDANAMAEDIAMNKTAYINGQKITGTLPLFPNSRTFTVDNAGVADNIEDSELEFTTINTAKQILDSNLNMKFSAPYSDIVTAIGLTADKLISGNTILGIEGAATTGIDTSDATATADDIVVNKTAYANGQKITGTIPTATTITEDGSVQLESDGRFRASATVPNDIYLHSDITPRMIWLNLTKSQVAETIGLTADKIVSGNTILDVVGTAPITGTDTSDATASANDIRFGESAYVNGEKIEGSLSTIFNLGYQVDSVVWTDETEQNQLKLDIPVNNSGIVNAGSSKIAVILRYDKLAEEIGLTAEKIKAGETILGITGTYTGDVESV